MINVAAKSEDESPITEQKRWSKGADSSVVNIISRINPSGTGKESAKRQRDENAKQRKVSSSKSCYYCSIFILSTMHVVPLVMSIDFLTLLAILILAH